MGRSSTLAAIALASFGLLTATDPARALCAVPLAGYQGGLYGAEAVTAVGCFVGVDTEGGTGATAAAASSAFIDSSTGVTYSLTSSADLADGLLTAVSETGVASASLWDTFTYSGLPAGGATVTATLSLTGTVTGIAFGNAEIQEGSQTDFANFTTASSNASFSAGSLAPSVSLSFNVVNGTPETVLAAIFLDGFGASGVANFGDPPTLTLSLPLGASVTTASGVFASFTTVPEPSTWAMMILGLAGLGIAGHRSRTRPLAPFG